MVDLDALRERMHDHDTINHRAVVILTAREVYDLLADIEALMEAKAQVNERITEVDAALGCEDAHPIEELPARDAPMTLAHVDRFTQTDGGKMLLLAAWLDERDDAEGFEGPRDVQADLRRWCDLIETTQKREARADNIEAAARHVVATPAYETKRAILARLALGRALDGEG